MALSFPSVLCNLGHQLSGAEDTLPVEDSISTLDHVRVAAFTNNIDRISCKPPVLQCDSMVPGSLFMYNESNEKRILKGNRNINDIPGLHVVGGAIMHTRTSRFAVSLLYSQKSKTIVVHAGGVPLAALEAELYDSAFGTDESWESYIMGGDKQEFVKWRKEAATDVRTSGLCNTPRYLLGKEHYHALRHGVTALLSLRAADNECEWSLVSQRLVSDLAVLPSGESGLIAQAEHHSSVATVFLARSDYELPVLREAIVRPTEERLQKAEEMLERGMLTWLAYVVLRNARDEAVDQQDEMVSEFPSGIRWKSSHKTILDRSMSSEVAHRIKTKTIKLTELEEYDESGFTLPSVMHGMNRFYTTKSICAINTDCGKTVMESVAMEVFSAADSKHVIEGASTQCSPNITPHSAICVLGKCLTESQAILLVSREPDGRIVNAKIVGHDIVVPHVNKDAMRRIILFPWVTVVIVDNDRVSILLVRDPHNDAAHGCFSRQSLCLRESAKPCVGNKPGVAELKGEMNLMREKMSGLETANTTLLKAVKDFERKLDYCVESQANRSGCDNLVDKHVLSVAANATLDSLKRTLNDLTSFEKRSRV